MTRPRIRRPPLWLATAIGFVFLSMTTLAAVRPMVSYKALELGATPAAIGVIAGAYALVALIMAIPLGQITDRIGPTPLMIGGGIGIALSSVAIGIAGQILTLALSQALLGLSFVMAQVGQQTLFAKAASPRDRDAIIGTVGAVGAFAQTVGPLLAGALGASVGAGLTRVFFVGASMALIAGVLATTIRQPAATTEPQPHQRDRAESRSTVQPRDPARISMLGILRIRGVTRAIIVSIAVMATIDMLVVYLPVYGEANGIPVGTITTLLAIRAGMSMVSRAAMPLLVRRVGRKRLLAIGTLAPGIAIVLLASTTHVPTLVALVAIAGFFLGIGQPLTFIWVIGQVPAAVRGTALGLRMSGNKLAQLVVPIMIGGVASSLGIAAAFGTIGLALGISSLTLRGLAIEENG